MIIPDETIIPDEPALPALAQVAIAWLTGAQRAAAETGYRAPAGQPSAGRMVKACALAAWLTA